MNERPSPSAADPYAAWQEGDISAEQALRALANDLAEVESDLEPLLKEREQLRAQLSEVVDALGGRYTLTGFGKLELTSAVKTASYDRKLLDALVGELVDAGDGALAQRIRHCRVESARAGSLRITRERSP